MHSSKAINFAILINFELWPNSSIRAYDIHGNAKLILYDQCYFIYNYFNNTKIINAKWIHNDKILKIKSYHKNNKRSTSFELEHTNKVLVQ